MLENVISDFIEQQFPQIYREEGQFFVQFVTEYYRWLESDPTSPVYNSRQHLQDHDIDTTVDSFILYYKEKYLKNIQINTSTNIKELIKNASTLYSAKGTENAIKLFFDLVFSAESEVYYPGTDVFRLSDAKWVVPKYIEITSTPMNRLFVGRAITGITSGATAFVERLVRRNANKNYVEVLYISAITGDFQTNETIRLTSDINNNYDNNPKITGSLTALDVLNGGEGFSKGDEVILKSVSGSEGKALVGDLSTITGIVDFSLQDGGWGYTVNTDIYTSQKILQLSNVHVVSTANLSLEDKITTVTQPMSNVQWFNNTAFFGVGNTVYNYYANGTLIGTNIIISAEYGTNATTNFFLLNTLNGNNFMDPTAPLYYTAGNTSSFQVQNAGWVDNTANGTTDGISSNVFVYCIGNSSAFVLNDVAYQKSTNNQVYANCTVNDITITGLNTFTLKVSGVDGLFLTDQTIYSQTTNSNVAIDSLSYDIGVHSVNGTFQPLLGNYIINTANTSEWNATIIRIPFGAGANTGFDPNLLNTEVVSLNINFVRDHMDETLTRDWVNATSYGANLNFANLTNMTLANSLMFTTKTLGTIGALKDQNPGALYTYAPFVDVIDPLVAPLHLEDYVIRLEDTSGVYTIGEKVTQLISGAIGIIKFANTEEIHVRRLTFEDKWTPGDANSSYLIVGSSSGHSAYPIEITSDIDQPAGHNAVVTTNVTSSNSTVSELIVTDSGFSFLNGEEVEFISLDGLRSGSALSTVNKQGFASGFYKTTSGFLSSNKYLYDGYFYQDLSYEIRTPVSAERYADMLKNVLHISGTQVFSAIKRFILNLLGISTVSKKNQGPKPTPTPLSPPVNTILPLILGTQFLGGILSIDNGTWLNSPTSYSYQWKRNGANISAATNSTYTVQNADLGFQITCLVTATNSAGSTPVTTSPVIPTAAPVNSVAPVVTGTPQTGRTVTALNGTWLNSPTSYSYQWKKNGTNISGEVNNIYTIAIGDAGANVLCTVTASNPSGSASADSNVIVPSTFIFPPVNSVAPVVSGSSIVASTVTTTNGTWSNSPTSYSYQWKRNGADIIGETSNSYILTSVDIGNDITCVVTAYNAAGSASVSSSNFIGPVTSAGSTPTNTVPPIISGTAVVGQTVSSSVGTWANTPTSYSYQWKRNGTNIAGATSSTYTLVTADWSQSIKCTVTATNSFGSASADSNTISPAGNGLSSPTMLYPNQSINPTTVGVIVPVDWQVGDTIKIMYSSSESMTSPTIISYILRSTDTPGSTITVGLPTLGGVTYFQAYGNHSGLDSSNLSNKVAWGSTTAPVISTATTQSQMELTPMAIALAADKTCTWAVTGGSDQTQCETSGTTLRWYKNGFETYGGNSAAGTNAFVVTVTATDLFGNSSSETITINLQQANKTPASFTYNNIVPSTASTTYMAGPSFAGTSTGQPISGLTAGISVSASVSGGQYSKNGGAWTAAGSFTIQNGDTIDLKATSGPGSSDVVNVIVTVGTYSTTWVVSNTLVTTVLPTTTGVDKTLYLTVASNQLTFTGDPNRGTDDGARVTGSGITDKRCYEVTINSLSKEINICWEYANPGYADLTSGGVFPGSGGAAQGTFYSISSTFIYNPSSGAIGSFNGAVGDIFQLDIDPAAGTADLYRIRGGVVTTIHNLTGLPTGKTWRAVVTAAGTGGISDQGTCNFGQNTPARTPTTGYKMYGAP